MPQPEVTPLTPQQERAYRTWVQASGITDADNPDAHYDYRGLFLARSGQPVPPRPGRHFPDTFKQHGHPTFSIESKYSRGSSDGGRWEGETYVPQTIKTYEIRDPQTGKTVVLKGDSPPTEAELSQIFAEINKGELRRPHPFARDQRPIPPVPDITSVPRRLVEGMARTLLPSTTPSDYIEGPKMAVTHPLDSLSLIWDAIKNASLAQGQKAADAVRATGDERTTAGRLGRVAEAAGHSFAAGVPVLGPAAASAGEHIGSGDIAGGIGEGLGLLVPTLAPKGRPIVSNLAERARAPLAAATETARGKLANVVGRGVEQRYVDVAAPKTGANKVRFGNDVAKVAPALAREPGLSAMSRGGLQSKVEARLSEAEAALDEASNARLSARTFPTKPIIDALLEKRRALTAETVEASKRTPSLSGQGGRPQPSGLVRDIQTGQMRPALVAKARPFGQDVVPAPNAARVAEIDRATAEIERLGPVARYEPLRRIRQAYDGPAKAIYAPSVTQDFLKAQGGKLGAADVTSVLRDHLAAMDPQTANANATYSLYRRASDAIRAAEETDRVRPNVFRKTMARVTGAATGEAAAGGGGAVIGVIIADSLDAVARSGLTTKIKTARLLATLEDALRGNRTDQVSAILSTLKRMTSTAGKTSVTMGRTQEAAGR